MDVIVVDSVTELPSETEGIVVAGSHCGQFAAHCVARTRVSAAILNDAGVGRDGAGISGLKFLDESNIPAAAVGHKTARIGDGKDCLARGRITFVNDIGRKMNIMIGMSAIHAVRCLESAHLKPLERMVPKTRGYIRILPAGVFGRKVILLDSISLVRPENEGAIVLAGSHGNLLGGRSESACRVDVFAALFNDACIGIDGAGTSRLPALDNRGIAAGVVDGNLARIGEGLSTYEDGVLTKVNICAANHGACEGMSAFEFVQLMKFI